MDNDKHKHPVWEPEQAHRRQLIWQILVPLAAVIIIAIVSSVLLFSNSLPEPTLRSKLVSVSTVILVLIWLLLSLVPLALTILGIWLMSKSEKNITPFLLIISVYLDRIKSFSQQVSDNAASPFIKSRSAFTGIKQLFNSTFHHTSSTKE